MPGPLITQKDMSTGSISFQGRTFGRPKGKAKEARVFFSFPSANVPESMPHGLGKKPTSFTVVNSGAASGGAFAAAGKIYARDPAMWASATAVTLVSDTATSWAEVIVRE